MDTNEYKNNSERDIRQKSGYSLILIISFALFLTGLLMLLFAFFIGGKQHTDEKSDLNVTDKQILTEDEESEAIFNEICEYYVMKEDTDGYISVYLSSGELYKRLDIPTYTLPSSDRARLRIGIMVRSDLELTSYIEGFSG